MDGIWLGHEWDWRTGRKGAPVVYDRDRNVTLFGPIGSGKGVSVEIPTLLRGGNAWGGRRFRCDSVVSLDPKAQNCAVTMRWRSRFSKIWVLNPMRVLGIPSTGFNFLRG